MHGPVPLLHVVRREEVYDAGELQQQVVLETEDGRRPDNGGLGEDFPRHPLGMALQAELVVWSSAGAGVRATLVAKNSEAELGSALYDETWMYRSTSYLATASAIRSVPSMCTSAREKFLAPSARGHQPVPRRPTHLVG